MGITEIKLYVNDEILIRPYKISDKKELSKLANNKKIAANLRDRFPYPYTKSDADSWIKINSNQTNPTNMAVIYKNNFVGAIGIILGEDIHRRNAEIGYWLGEEFWGNRVMSKSVPVFVDYAFENFNLLRIYAGVFHTNKASAKVLENAGFSLESIKRNAIDKWGDIKDELIYSVLK